MSPVTLRPATLLPVVAFFLLSGMTPLPRIPASFVPSDTPLASFAALVAPPVTRAFADEGAAEIETTREELRRLRSELARERWEALTNRRPEQRAHLFRAHAALLSHPTLVSIRVARDAAIDSLEIGRLEQLELDLAQHAMLAGVAPQDDEIARLMLELEADVEDYPQPLTLRDLDHWIARDPDSLRVRMLESVRLGLWRDRFDPLFESRRTTIDSLALAFGYDGYTEFSARLRRCDPGQVLAQLFSLVRATDTMYQVLTRELARPASAGPPGRGSRVPSLSARDMARLEWTDEFDRYVDSSEILARALVDTVLGGAEPERRSLPVVTAVRPSMTHEGSAPVTLSAADVRAEVVAIDPPVDIRVAVTDLTGVASARAALAAAGAARRLSALAESSLDPREGGSDLPGLAAGHLHAGMVSTPEWYEERRRLDREAGRESDIARLSDLNLARLIRWRLWCDLKWIRTDLASGILTELIRHRAGTDLWMPFVFVPPGTDEHELIRQIRSFALGSLLSPADACDALRPGADFLGALDEARGLALAATVEERLRADPGPAWFHDPAAAREPIFQTGDIGTTGEVDFDPLRRRFERLFDWSEQALEGGQ